MRPIRPMLTLALLLAPAPEALAQATLPLQSASPPTSSASVPQALVRPRGGNVSSPPEIVTEFDPAMGEKASSLYNAGNLYFREAKYAKAQAEYTAARALSPYNAKIVGNLAMTELELKMYRDAAEHFSIALRLSEANDPQRGLIMANLFVARAKVGIIQMKVMAGGKALDKVEIVQMETGRSYKTPLFDPIFVDPGLVSLRVRREGYESQEKAFGLKAGEEATWEVTLVRPADYPGAATGGTGEMSKVPLLVAGGMGLAGGLAAAIAGAALVGAASGVASDIRSRQPPGSPCQRAPQPGENDICPDLRSEAQQGSTRGNIGVGLLVDGGALATAGVVLLVLSLKKAPEARATSVVPLVGKEGGGLVLTGSF